MQRDRFAVMVDSL